MRRSFLIFILPLLLLVQNDTKAQQVQKGVVLYASREEIKAPPVSSVIASSINNENISATTPFKSAYYDNYYGTETFEVYAGNAVNQSLVYLKVTTHLIIPITVMVVNCHGEEILRCETVKHPMAIGYGFKPGIYFIHICQGKNEMVLRFSKGV